uniref:Uncharacterized protein n=1 Tax=Cannabis sativa TaxID=3483 RepID=A0A803QC26_CANSA
MPHDEGSYFGIGSGQKVIDPGQRSKPQKSHQSKMQRSDLGPCKKPWEATVSRCIPEGNGYLDFGKEPEES